VKTVPGPPKGNSAPLKPSIRQTLSAWEIIHSPTPELQQKKAPEAEAKAQHQNEEEEPHGRVTIIPRKSRPSLLLASEKTTTRSKKRAAPGTATKALVAEAEIVPEPPAKRTRSGRVVKPTAKAVEAAKGG